VFINGQINNAQVSYTLSITDADHIALSGQRRSSCSAANNSSGNCGS
jgi:hypothetical protein